LAFVSSLAGWGGGEQWMLSAAVAMQDRGHRVLLLVQPGSELASRGRTSGLEVAEVRLGGWLDPASLAGLASHFRRARVDVVCANLDKEIRQARLAAMLAGRSIKLVARRGSPDPIKDNWHYRLVYDHGLQRLICNCEALVESVCSRAPWFDRSRVRVIYNGVDTVALEARADEGDIRAELDIEPGMPVVSCVGEVGWRKGQEHVLAAASALKDRFPKAVWLIAGEGDGRVELEARAQSAGLLDHGRVRFLGFRRDVPAILKATDVLVLPSRMEGFPNTLLEGMALGLPVAASNADGIPELVEHGVTGLVHEVDDVETLTAHVGRFLTEEWTRLEMGRAGLTRVQERFTQDVVMDQLESCLCRW